MKIVRLLLFVIALLVQSVLSLAVILIPIGTHNYRAYDAALVLTTYFVWSAAVLLAFRAGNAQRLVRTLASALLIPLAESSVIYYQQNAHIRYFNAESRQTLQALLLLNCFTTILLLAIAQFAFKKQNPMKSKKK